MKEVLIRLVLALLPVVVVYLGVKFKTNKLIRDFVPDAVEFAGRLDIESQNKLKRAIADVENKVLENVPVVYRPLVDALINVDYIVKHIERYISEQRRKQS